MGLQISFESKHFNTIQEVLLETKRIIFYTSIINTNHKKLVATLLHNISST